MTTQINNLHAFTIKYLGATNTKGSRIKITSERFEQSITISYNHEFNSAIDCALAYLLNKGFNIVGQAEIKSIAGLLLSDTFEPLKNA